MSTAKITESEIDITIAYIRQLIEADRAKTIGVEEFVNDLCGIEAIVTTAQDDAEMFLDSIQLGYGGSRTTFMQFDDNQLEEYAAVFG